MICVRACKTLRAATLQSHACNTELSLRSLRVSLKLLHACGGMNSIDRNFEELKACICTHAIYSVFFWISSLKLIAHATLRAEERNAAYVAQNALCEWCGRMRAEALRTPWNAVCDRHYLCFLFTMHKSKSIEVLLHARMAMCMHHVSMEYKCARCNHAQLRFVPCMPHPWWFCACIC